MLGRLSLVGALESLSTHLCLLFSFSFFFLSLSVTHLTWRHLQRRGRKRCSYSESWDRVPVFWEIISLGDLGSR